MLGPPLLVGDRVAHLGEEEPVLGSVRWLGRLPDLFPHQLVAGLTLDEPQASCSVTSMGVIIMKNSKKDIYETPVAKRPAAGVLLNLYAIYSNHFLMLVSRFNAGGVGGWLRSLFNAGVSSFNAGGVGGWLHSLFKATFTFGIPYSGQVFV